MSTPPPLVQPGEPVHRPVARRPVWGWLAALALLVWGLLNTYAHIRLGYYPRWDTTQGPLVATAHFLFPLVPALVFLGALLWVVHLHHLSCQAMGVLADRELPPSPLAPVLSGFLGVVFGVILTLATSWTSAEIDAGQTINRYQTEVQAFQWLYGDRSTVEGRAPALWASSALAAPAKLLPLDDHACAEARRVLPVWLKYTHNALDFSLQQDMVFLAWQHGCLGDREVFEWNARLMKAARHSHTRADILFPFLFEEGRKSAVDSLVITRPRWCAMVDHVRQTVPARARPASCDAPPAPGEGALTAPPA